MERGLGGHRMPERGKSGFATVSDTYIRRGGEDGKRVTLDTDYGSPVGAATGPESRDNRDQP